MARIMALIFLLALGAASPTPTGERMTIAHVQRGIVYWHGHRLTPPYEIAIAMRTEPDTIVENIYINDLPVFLNTRKGTNPLPERQLTKAEMDTLKREIAVFDRAGEAEWAARSRGANDLEQAQAWAEVLRRDLAYVDSVFINPVQTPPFTRFVYWRGRSDPVPVGVGTVGPRQPRLRRAFETATPIATALERGDLILVGHRGPNQTVPAVKVKAALAEIEAIKEGGPRKTWFITDREMVQALRAPRPLQELLEGGQ